MDRHRSRRSEGGAMALVIVDMINPLDFRGGVAILPRALAAARRIDCLKQRLKAGGNPVVYANDNFTKWRMGFSEIVAICANDSRSADIARANIGSTYHGIASRPSAISGLIGHWS